MSQNLYKRYVDVVIMVDKNGGIKPLSICWEDGKSYPIDRVVSIEPRASVVGGCGMRYTCMIQGQTRHLFLEKNRFFIESYLP